MMIKIDSKFILKQNKSFPESLKIKWCAVYKQKSPTRHPHTQRRVKKLLHTEVFHACNDTKKKLDQDNIKKKKKYFKSNKPKNFLVLPDHDARR